MEQPVINFDEEDEEPISMDDDEDKSQEKMETDTPAEDRDKEDTQEEEVTKKKPGMHMSFEDYRQTSNLLVLYMRQEEEKEGRVLNGQTL